MSSGPRSTPTERPVSIASGRRLVEGILSLPPACGTVVVFAHGSGSGRYSPRNQLVARALQEAGLGTLLIDLLEPNEAEDRARVFDIALLASRLQAAADWLAHESPGSPLRVGYFGASTGAAAALKAAAVQPERIGAVVSRGGRPDLAWDDLPHVAAPTLLIVGGNDDVVLDWNRQALERLRCPKQLEVISGATHLFPEPGALEAVARLARDWFLRYATPEAAIGDRVARSDMDPVC
jgi:putative phosphoribosyl transferase